MNGRLGRIFWPVAVFVVVAAVSTLLVATGVVPSQEREVAPTPTTAPTLEIILPAGSAGTGDAGPIGDASGTMNAGSEGAETVGGTDQTDASPESTTGNGETPAASKSATASSE